MKRVKMSSPVFIICLSIGFLFLIPGMAKAVPLGIASDYNEFIFQNIDQSGTESNGRVAAGGDLSYVDMGVATQVAGSYPLGDLSVGGDLTWTRGSVGTLDKSDSSYQGGSIFVGGVATLVDVGYGSLEYGTPIDFASAQTYLSNSSLYWAGLAATGTTGITIGNENNNLITLTGTNPTLNVFSLAGDDLMKASNFDINVPSGSTVLVNIDGTGGGMQKLGFGPDAVNDPSYILYNFYEATSLTFGNIAILGSVLAPWANIDFSDGHIEGQLIALSLFGTAEAWNELFRGDLPAAAVPEPSTLLLLGTGITGLVLWGRKGFRS
jgi:choice-of-anchor A domain-containing protein